MRINPLKIIELIHSSQNGHSGTIAFENGIKITGLEYMKQAFNMMMEVAVCLEKENLSKTLTEASKRRQARTNIQKLYIDKMEKWKP